MTKIKICGLKTLEDVAAVNQVKTDYVGFVFANTKRYVTDAQAKVMREMLLPEIQTVGVFVNEPIEHVIQLCREGTIQMIQLHGDESEAYAKALRNKVDNPIIRAIRVQSTQQILEAKCYPCDYFLFDTYKKDSYGGTGETFDRTLIPSINKPFFLAGGLREDNVQEAIGQCAPYAVDVSSSVETEGSKDVDKIVAFVKKVRSYHE